MPRSRNGSKGTARHERTQPRSARPARRFRRLHDRCHRRHRDGDDGRPLGFTANSFASVSLSPPLLLVCIAKTSRNDLAMTRAAGFAVNILAEDQKQVSNTFAKPVEDRFSCVDRHRGIAGRPARLAADGRYPPPLRHRAQPRQFRRLCRQRDRRSGPSAFDGRLRSMKPRQSSACRGRDPAGRRDRRADPLRPRGDRHAGAGRGCLARLPGRGCARLRVTFRERD